MQILQWLILLISTAIFFLIQGILVFVVFNKKHNIRLLLLFSIINAVVRDSLITALGEYIPAISLLIYLLAIVLTIIFVLKIKFLQAICAASVLVILSTILNYVVVAILRICVDNKLDYALWEKSFSYMLIGENLGNLLLLIALLVIYYFKMKIIIPEDLNRVRVFNIIINTLITCVIIIPNMLFFENRINIIPLQLIVFNAISVVILFLISVYNSVRSGELETKKQEIEFQKLYINTLNDTIDGMRSFKHDYNNIVQAIGGYLSLDNIDGLKKYYQQMQKDSRIINNIFPLNSYVKNHPAIYGLLLSKLSYAELMDIQFIINITAEIEVSSIKTFDLCKVLGILFDNALEAAADSSKKYIELFIKKMNDDEGLFIEIINSYQGDIDSEVIFNNGFTTKEGHSGFGLWEVKKIISKYKNCSLKTYVNNGVFSQQIEILNS